jgi:hypothetical protein
LDDVFSARRTPDTVLMREAIGFGSLNLSPSLRLRWVRTEASAGRFEARLSIDSLVTFAAVALASVQRPVVVAAYAIVAIAAFVQMASYRRLMHLLAAGEEDSASGANP